MKKYTVIKAGLMIDGKGTVYKEDPVLILRGGKILKVGRATELEIPADEDCTLIKADNKTVMPGLIDAHTHIQMSAGVKEYDLISRTVPYWAIRAGLNARKTLEAGFTTIRDLGAENLIDLAVRDAVNEGLIAGPRILASGYRILPTGADFQIYPPGVTIPGRRTMDSPYEIRKEIRTLVARGVDLIKVLTSGRTFKVSSSPDAQTFSREEMEAVVTEAHNHGKRVSAHAHGAKGVKLALETGCDTIEHGTELDIEDIEFMAEKGIFLIPTFSYSGNLIELGDSSGLPPFIVEKALRSREKRLQSFQLAKEGGVPIALGSDSGMPFVDHGKNARELQEFVKAGMTPHEAITAATQTAASALGIEDITGTLEEGKAADILIINGNPLQDISVLMDKNKILAVFKEGSLVVNRSPRLIEVD